MNEFKNMTLMAAAEVILASHSHADLEGLEMEWGLHGRCRTDTKKLRVVDFVSIATKENPDVFTPTGKMKLERAMVEKAFMAPLIQREGESWRKLLAGLRFDGFDLHEKEQQVRTAKTPWEPAELTTRLVLVRMLPEDIPGANLRETENEIVQLLADKDMTVSKGHMEQAISAFSRGEWASANAQLRTFYESYLDEIAIALGCNKSISSKDKRDHLGKIKPPFLSEGLNEWNANNQKPQYIQGLMSRMHPEGSHAGLSEEDDATFRLQITLITARLLLRRFSKYLRHK